MHVFLRQDIKLRALETLYSGPHKMIARKDKGFQIIVRGRQITVSADRVKSAYLLEESHEPVTHQTILETFQESQIQHFILEPHAPGAK